MKNTKIFTAIMLLLLSITACKKSLDINDPDPNYLSDADPKLLLPSGITFSAARIGGDYQLIGSIWSQHYTQSSNSSQYRTLDSYNLTNSSYNAAWNNLWAGALKDLKNSMVRAEANGQWNYYVASAVIAAFDYHILNDFYGAIPIAEGLDYTVVTQPKYVESREANQLIIQKLDDAIAKGVQAADLDPMGKEDFIFGGDIDNWIKFAKSLKLKLLMRDFEANRTAITALLTENDLLTVDAKMDVFVDAENKSNPFYEQDRRKLNTAGNLRASNTLLKFLQANDDPRVGAFYEKTGASASDDTFPEYVGLEQGDYGAVVDASATSRAILEATDPVFFMSAAEVAFLKAEAYARLNQPANAKTNYDAGVTFAFQRWTADDVTLDAAPFIAAGGAYEFIPGSVEDMVRQIITQKWVAAARSQAWDSFFDQNRTGYPEVSDVDTEDDAYVVGQYTYAINSVLADGLLPRRLLFPKSSSDYNPNTPPVVPISELMWWHKAN